jgi:hypothetical protein
MENNQMVIKVDSLLNKMSKDQLKTIIGQYEQITERLKYEILLLKYEILISTPELELKMPIQNFIKEIDIEDMEPDDIPVIDPNLSIKRKCDVAYQ